MKSLNHNPNEVLKNLNEILEPTLADETFLSTQKNYSISIDGEYIVETTMHIPRTLPDFEIF
jgi:hypothetical protein